MKHTRSNWNLVSWFLQREKKQSIHGGKQPSHSEFFLEHKGKNKNQIQHTYDITLDPGFKLGPNFFQASALTTTPLKPHNTCAVLTAFSLSSSHYVFFLMKEAVSGEIDEHGVVLNQS